MRTSPMIGLLLSSVLATTTSWCAEEATKTVSILDLVAGFSSQASTAATATRQLPAEGDSILRLSLLALHRDLEVPLPEPTMLEAVEFMSSVRSAKCMALASGIDAYLSSMSMAANADRNVRKSVLESIITSAQAGLEKTTGELGPSLLTDADWQMGDWLRVASGLASLSYLETEVKKHQSMGSFWKLARSSSESLGARRLAGTQLASQLDGKIRDYIQNRLNPTQQKNALERLRTLCFNADDPGKLSSEIQEDFIRLSPAQNVYRALGVLLVYEDHPVTTPELTNALSKFCRLPGLEWSHSKVQDSIEEVRQDILMLAIRRFHLITTLHAGEVAAAKAIWEALKALKKWWIGLRKMVLKRRAEERAIKFICRTAPQWIELESQWSGFLESHVERFQRLANLERMRRCIAESSRGRESDANDSCLATRDPTRAVKAGVKKLAKLREGVFQAARENRKKLKVDLELIKSMKEGWDLWKEVLKAIKGGVPSPAELLAEKLSGVFGSL